jgi:hypothetical protein
MGGDSPVTETSAASTSEACRSAEEETDQRRARLAKASGMGSCTTAVFLGRSWRRGRRWWCLRLCYNLEMALGICCWCGYSVFSEQKLDDIYAVDRVEWKRKAPRGFCDAYNKSSLILLASQIGCSEKRVWQLHCGPIENCYSGCLCFVSCRLVYSSETIEIVADVAPQV